MPDPIRLDIPYNADLMTYFNTGQSKTLQKLGDLIGEGTITYIINNPISIELALDDLTDVVAPSPVTGNTIVWDGTQWENDFYKTVITTVTASDDLDSTNANRFLVCTNGPTLTIQSGLPVGTFWEVMQNDASAVTIAAGSGVTLKINAVFDTPVQTNGDGAVIGIKHIGSETYVVFGNLVQV